MSKRVIINTESVNRSGYRILNAGGRLEAYTANPVLLYNHDRNRLPIGKLTDLKVEGDKLSALPEFDMQDSFAASVADKWNKGILSAASLGINILSVSTAKKDMIPGQSRGTVTAWDLLEVSIVDIPRNQDCVKLSLSDGADAQLDEVLPTFTHTQPIQMDILKVKAALGLAADATDETVAQAVTTLKTERTAALLALGRAKGVITDANAKQYEALATADYANTLALLDSAAPDTAATSGKAEEPTMTALLKAVQEANAGNGRADDPNDRSKWSFDDYQRKDPTGLLKLKNEKPEVYKTLAMEYGK